MISNQQPTYDKLMEQIEKQQTEIEQLKKDNEGFRQDYLRMKNTALRRKRRR